jgi:hypothetical protein
MEVSLLKTELSVVQLNTHVSLYTALCIVHEENAIRCALQVRSVHISPFYEGRF